MKNNNYTSVVLIFFFLIMPIFVLAKTCYVEDGVGSGGDGSESSPYETIGKAVNENCSSIKVEKGIYSEDVTLEDDVYLEGDGKETVVEGDVIMKDDTKLKDVYVKDHGIEISKNSTAIIDSVRVRGANIGILTKGSGKLTVLDSELSNNRKGFYIQYGKDVNIRNNEVTDNDEEAIDIRANVDGIIRDNKINDNRESGIEVIAGKSELNIVNNELKNNKSSGIAVQFYKETSDLGNLKISGNTLTGNSNYGIDCKSPSGGTPEYKYWSKSVKFSFNKIEDNKKGDFSINCQFSEYEILEATKTAEEIRRIKEELVKKESEERLSREEAEELAVLKGEGDLKEQRELEEKIEKELEEKKIAAQLKKDEDIESEINLVFRGDVSKWERVVSAQEELTGEESAVKIFFFGPSEEVVKTIEKNIVEYQNDLEKVQKLFDKIENKNIKTQMQARIEKEKSLYRELNNIDELYRNQFGIIPWIKSLF